LLQRNKILASGEMRSPGPVFPRNRPDRQKGVVLLWQEHEIAGAARGLGNFGDTIFARCCGLNLLRRTKNVAMQQELY
jgi:hypothetical protein